MTTAPISTKNLKLIPKTLEQIRAMVEAMPPHEKAFLSADWLARLRQATTADVWAHGFTLVLRDGDIPVGHAGFTKPPGPDGLVEIGYGVNPEYQGKGFATEATQALLAFAFESGRVRVVRAHTLPQPNASTRVLTKCGFQHLGEIDLPEDGVVWRWEKQESAHDH